MANPSKILGLGWDKQNDTIEVTIPQQVEEEHVTKKTILSHLGSIYDPLGILSPTTVEGKRIYREACDEKNGWNGEISDPLKKQWTKWTKQLKSVTVPRSIMRNVTKTKTVHLHIFADASNLACCAAAIYSSRWTQWRHGQGPSYIEIKNLQERHYHSKVRTGWWSNGGKLDKESPQCPERMATGKHHSLGG